MGASNRLAAAETACPDRIVLDAVATQRANWRQLWAAIAASDRPEDVPETLWTRTLSTEQLIADNTQAAITGCPCQHCWIGDSDE